MTLMIPFPSTVDTEFWLKSCSRTVANIIIMLIFCDMLVKETRPPQFGMDRIIISIIPASTPNKNSFYNWGRGSAYSVRRICEATLGSHTGKPHREAKITLEARFRLLG